MASCSTRPCGEGANAAICKIAIRGFDSRHGLQMYLKTCHEGGFFVGPVIVFADHLLLLRVDGDGGLPVVLEAPDRLVNCLKLCVSVRRASSLPRGLKREPLSMEEAQNRVLLDPMAGFVQRCGKLYRTFRRPQQGRSACTVRGWPRRGRGTCCSCAELTTCERAAQCLLAALASGSPRIQVV